MVLIKIYKIVNSVDDMIYIGSTKLSLQTRYDVHKRNCIIGITFKIYQHMRRLGMNKFEIILIRECEVKNKIEKRQEEQKEIDKQDKNKLLNMTRALRDPNKKLKSRMTSYYKNKQDPIWLEKERERNKIRSQLRRDKQRCQRLNGDGGNLKIQSDS